MRTTKILILLALAAPLTLARSQEGVAPVPDELETVQARTPIPALASDPPGSVAPLSVAADERETPELNEDGGEGLALPAVLDDSVPLPIPAVTESSAEGDRILQPASGDPFFLGFETGAYYPPQGEPLDPALSANVLSAYSDGRPQAVTYGFAMFSRRITPERVAELEELGVRVLGFHPHHALRVAVPVGSVEALVAHDAVHWLGVPRPWQKVHHYLADRIAEETSGQPLDVWVNVFESDLNEDSTSQPLGAAYSVDPGGEPQPVDAERAGLPLVWQSNGWQQRALESLGLEVLEYVDSIRAFRARMHPASLEQVVGLDFVQFVESDVPVEFAHDESTPLVLADVTRASNDGGGNGVAVAGVIDSGYDYNHHGLNHVYGWGWDLAGTASGPWGDLCEHGSHVAGTILGLPDSASAGYRGISPGLGGAATLRVFNVKMGTDGCGTVGTLNQRLNPMRFPVNDGSGNITPIPHAINCSWGSAGTGWTGTEADARLLDTDVFTYHQLYVFAAGNEGSSGSNIRLPAVAKNAFTVGAVVDYGWASGDPGTLYSGSSRGPTGDSRWKPNLAAPGRWIRSVDANSTTLYSDKWGTSMAAPHVTGAAAQLADVFSYLRYQPDRLAAALMASAFTHNDQVLTSPSSSTTNHLNMYGAGRLNLNRATFASSSHSLSNWGFTGTGANWHYSNFTVASGTQRLIVVMTYHEAAASSGASQALVNDWDLWLDGPSGGIDPGGNTGEYFAQQSAINNTEIRIINSPQVGSWRWKVYPDSVTSNCEISVVVGRITGDTTPNGTLTVSADDSYVQPNDDVVLTATAFNPEYNASAIFLDSSSSGDSLQAASTTLADGAVTNLMTNQHGGRDITLGSLAHASSRSAQWRTRWATQGLKSWSVNARSDNWVDRTAAVNVYVDGTDPAQVTNLQSPTHTPSVWSNDPNITYTWTAATDNLSGIDGYGLYTTLGGPGLPSTVRDIGALTSFGETLSTSTQGWYFNIRSVDRSGNWDATAANTGPYRIDTVAPGAIQGLTSPSHSVGVQSCDNTITWTWTGASDAHSGLAGYALAADTNPGTIPTIVNFGAGVTTATTVPLSAGSYYLHARTRDVAGNYGPTVHRGPYPVNASSVSTYCTGKLNSAGCVPAIGSTNQPSMSASNFTVTARFVVNKKNGILFYGPTPGAVPFQGGLKCVLSPTRRAPLQNSGGSTSGSDCTGTFAFTFTQAFMLAKGISVGDTVYCQWWYRDPTVTVGTTGLSNALKFTVCQ